MKAGMVGHLPKPIDPLALATVLSRYASAIPVSAPRHARPSGSIDETYVRSLIDSLGAAKVGQLISELPQHARPHRDRLAAGRGDMDLVQMRAAAHALTGMAANLGLTALADLTGAIEEACRAGQVGEVASLCGQLDASFEDVLARIEAFCPDRSASA
jgi:HPt (histidine-containing phosphotransfer) domain-containing protein